MSSGMLKDYNYDHHYFVLNLHTLKSKSMAMFNVNKLQYFCVVLPDLLLFIFTGLQHSCWGKRCTVVWWAETEDCHCSCFGTKANYFAS